MDARRFWAATGVVAGLAGRGFPVLAPDRLARAADWTAEARWLASVAESAGWTGARTPMTVVAGSNGCSAGVLAQLTMPTGVLGSVPANPVHQRRTVHTLLELLPDAAELVGCPEPPRPEFPAHRDEFLRGITEFAA